MAVHHATTNVGTTPVQLFAVPSGTLEFARVYITNHDNAAIFVGDATVATSGSNMGFTIVKDGNYDFEMRANETIYAISATSANVTVLAFGV